MRDTSQASPSVDTSGAGRPIVPLRRRSIPATRHRRSRTRLRPRVSRPSGHLGQAEGDRLSTPAKKSAAPSAPAKQEGGRSDAPAKDTTAQDAGTQVSVASCMTSIIIPRRSTPFPAGIRGLGNSSISTAARCHGEDVLGTTSRASHHVAQADGPINSKELSSPRLFRPSTERIRPGCSLGLVWTNRADLPYVKGRSDGKIIRVGRRPPGG